ncbi:hypothetical protein [Streptomyces longispororuber]|uniref:hypothetical protein n=1 Tax=Streptomyces longispororuber TaxID=68230 RepID=UPI002108DAEB|nr:hypothetical protein [Streptomyces longispororuber]MCQ4211508.1 hypothetical protein [Streptomyces longispororuber]
MVRIQRLTDLKPARRRQVAVLALWRWRTPVLGCRLTAEWGLDQSVLESLFRLAASPAGDESDRAYLRAIAELRTAPLFTSEVDPDTVQLFQLETINNLLAFGELLERPGVGEVERVAEASAGLAHYLDELIEGSLYSHPSEEAHRQYLAGLVGRTSEGYFASRHFAVETRCRAALDVLPDSSGLLDSSTGRELLALCEDFGEELATTLRWLRTTGH